MSVIGNIIIKPASKEKENSFNNSFIKSLSVINKKLKQIDDKVRDNQDECTESRLEVKMEHSYSRDCRPMEGVNGLKTRTLMVHKAPQCPSCHTHPSEEGNDLDESNQPSFPCYNEVMAKDAMTECTRISNSVRNTNSDDVNWENCVNKTGWTFQQENLFNKMAEILDHDHLARLATMGKQHEPVQKRVIIDKSAQRVRKAFASISWDSFLTQWLHVLLTECLPPLYMASYLDILQTLKTKLPALVDKLLFSKPMNINQDLLVPVLKPQWDPVILRKQRSLPANCVMIIIQSTPTTGSISSRMQKWLKQFSTMAQIVQIHLPAGTSINKQPVEQIAEQIVQITRLKIQELKSEQSDRHICLVGFNAGAALTLQVALSETVNSIVCIGFAYNTINGARGAPDDRILDITIPILFVLGQNSAKTSQEEIESLREKMQSETSLLVVGSADDVLRVPKNKRLIESVTQTMVDSMVTDEVYEFIKTCMIDPPGPRTPSQTHLGTPILPGNLAQSRKATGQVTSAPAKKRKNEEDGSTPTKKQYNKGTLIGRPRTRPLKPPATPTKHQQQRQVLTQPSDDTLSMAIQSILPEDKISTSTIDNEEILRTFELITATPSPTKPGGQQSLPQVTTIQTPQQRLASTPKIKMIPANQFVHLKPSLQSQSKIYTIKPTESQRQIFTIKNPTPQQYTKQPSAIVTNQVVLSPQKFTVLKSGTTNIINANQSKHTAGTFQEITSCASDLSTANIFDMPIVFADNDGNIQEAAQLPTNTSITAISQAQHIQPIHNQIIIKSNQNETSNQSSSGTLVLNTSNDSNSLINKQKSGKVVFINRNTMKPCPNIISKSSVPPMKYTKVVVTNPKTSVSSLVTKAGSSSDSISISPSEPKRNVPTIVPKSGILNLQTNKIQTKPPTGVKQFQPIILNIDSEKAKNLIKIDPSQIIKTSGPGATIYLKHSGLTKPLPVIKGTESSGTSLNKNLPIKQYGAQSKSATTVVNTSTGQITQVNTVKLPTGPFVINKSPSFQKKT